MLMVVIKELPKMFDIEGLNSNFTLKLPFKNLKLSTNSEVSDRLTVEWTLNVRMNGLSIIIFLAIS